MEIILGLQVLKTDLFEPLGITTVFSCDCVPIESTLSPIFCPTCGRAATAKTVRFIYKSLLTKQKTFSPNVDQLAQYCFLYGLTMSSVDQHVYFFLDNGQHSGPINYPETEKKLRDKVGKELWKKGKFGWWA